MSSIETSIQYSKKIENILESGLNASGRGLHEKVTSVESKLSSRLVKKIRWIATLRNKAVHEDFEIEDLDRFIEVSEDAIKELNNQIEVIEQKARYTDNLSKENESKLEQKVIIKKSGGTIFKVLLGISLFINYFMYTGLEQVKREKSLNYSELSSLKSKYKNAKDEIVSLKDKVSYKQKQINDLTKKNKKFFDTINTLSQVNSSSNKAKTNKLPVKKGSLLALASKSKNEYEEAKNNIDNYFESIANDLKVTLGKPSIRSTKKGTVDLIYPVSWHFNKSRLDNLLDPYFTKGFEKKNTSVKSVSRYNLKKSNKPYAKDLFEYLGKKKMSIQLTAGKYSSTLLIASKMDCHVNCYIGKDYDQYHIQFKSSKNRLDYNQTNPIEIKDVPEKYLNNIKEVEVKVIVH